MATFVLEDFIKDLGLGQLPEDDDSDPRPSTAESDPSPSTSSSDPRPSTSESDPRPSTPCTSEDDWGPSPSTLNDAMTELDELFPDPPSPTAAEEPPTTEEPAEEPSDPPLPTFTQEPPTTDIMEDLGLEEPSPTPLPSTFAKPCPVPGCSKIIKKMWNHLFQVHKPQGQYTGMRHAVYSYHVWLTVLHFQMLS